MLDGYKPIEQNKVLAWRNEKNVYRLSHGGHFCKLC